MAPTPQDCVRGSLDVGWHPYRTKAGRAASFSLSKDARRRSESPPGLRHGAQTLEIDGAEPLYEQQATAVRESAMPIAKKARAIGFNHVALEVGDIDEALAFYGRLFEFKLRGKSKDSAFIDLGDQFIA
ncbi:MAG: VOC family protein, partial [Dongiaceae bacterium]